MKKSCFKVLCMVLIIALLAPNAFAAAPAPEAPLADAATVARVKQEIAAGEITDMEDLFLVAYQHLGADLEEEGMTAYINEDGTLGITQIINASKSKDGRLTKTEYAKASILLVDTEYKQITHYSALLSNTSARAYNGLDSVMVYATHIAYYYEQLAQRNDGIWDFQAKLSHMETTLTYGTNAFSASRLEQSFIAQQNHFDLPHEGVKVTHNPDAGQKYEYEPTGTKWYWSALADSSVWGGHISTCATIYIANSSLSFTVNTQVSFFVDTSYPRGVLKNV